MQYELLKCGRKDSIANFPHPDDKERWRKQRKLQGKTWKYRNLKNNPFCVKMKYGNGKRNKIFKQIMDNNYKKYNNNELITEIAKFIKEEKIVALFRERMEFGARALGNRSIIASPKHAEMRKKLNKIISQKVCRFNKLIELEQ